MSELRDYQMRVPFDMLQSGDWLDSIDSLPERGRRGGRRVYRGIDVGSRVKDVRTNEYGQIVLDTVAHGPQIYKPAILRSMCVIRKRS